MLIRIFNLNKQSFGVLHQECVFNIVKREFIVHQIIKLRFIFKQQLVILLRGSLSHHRCTTCHHFHLLNRFIILKKECQYSIESIDQKERPKLIVNDFEVQETKFWKIYLPTHWADIGGIKGCDIETLLQHLFKLKSKWEWNLSGDETLEDASNYCKGHHMNDTLNVLLKHVVHHVRIAHHVHWRCFNFLS